MAANPALLPRIDKLLHLRETLRSDSPTPDRAPAKLRGVTSPDL